MNKLIMAILETKIFRMILVCFLALLGGKCGLGTGKSPNCYRLYAWEIPPIDVAGYL